MKSRSQRRVRGGGVRSGTRECRSCQALHSRNNLWQFTLKANAAIVFNPLIKELSIVVVVEFLACLNIALCQNIDATTINIYFAVGAARVVNIARGIAAW